MHFRSRAGAQTTAFLRTQRNAALSRRRRQQDESNRQHGDRRDERLAARAASSRRGAARAPAQLLRGCQGVFAKLIKLLPLATDEGATRAPRRAVHASAAVACGRPAAAILWYADSDDHALDAGDQGCALAAFERRRTDWATLVTRGGKVTRHGVTRERACLVGAS